ncbi:MAG: phosphoribosyltransferase, partial [Bacteroidota bacterium]
MDKLFVDRFAAGRTLVEEIRKLYLNKPVVLAIPRGGIKTGRAIADELHLPLDIILCKKVGHPENPELAVGSVCADGTTIQTMDVHTADPDYFEHQAARLRTWLLGRYQQLTGRETPMDVSGREVILNDDGMATGSTMLAAIRSIRTAGAGKVVVAVPAADQYPT